ncbi:MAG: Ubiquinone/menaquinone biosynthesis C-methyltransferase UbiE [Nitrosomonadaceae bacterium]|nr:Ubiquinone/menaquinone biosynthesis C-methyltransferase UbiE [Nitrosomonadaceae bacterium]
MTIKFPPSAESLLVERLAEVQKEWRLDNGAWCLEELRDICNIWPWSKEATTLYGHIVGKLAHLETKIATYRMHEWMAVHQVVTQAPYQLNHGVTRMELMLTELSKAYEGQEGLTLLDIGAQMGEMTIFFSDLPFVKRAYACEVSHSNATWGHRWYYSDKLAYFNAFADELPFASNSQDIVVLSGVLEHTTEPLVWLDEAERVCKPGGMMVIQCPYGAMEDPVNPDAAKWGFRCHVGKVNPNDILRGKEPVFFGYIDYKNNPQMPHSWYGELGDWVMLYKKPE